MYSASPVSITYFNKVTHKASTFFLMINGGSVRLTDEKGKALTKMPQAVEDDVKKAIWRFEDEVAVLLGNALEA